MVFKHYEVGDELVGIRTNSEAFGEWLDRTFSAYATDRVPQHYYHSVWLPDPDRRGIGRRYTTIYERDGAAVRTFSLEVIARALINSFSVWTCNSRSDGVYLDGGIVRIDGSNILLSGQVMRWLGQHQRRLSIAGAMLSAENGVALDPAARTVERLPWPDVPRDAIEALAGTDAANAVLDRFSLETPVRIDAACEPDHIDPPARPSSPIELVTQTYAVKALNMIPSGGQILPGIIDVLTHVPCYTLSTKGPQIAIDGLAQIASGTVPSKAEA